MTDKASRQAIKAITLVQYMRRAFVGSISPFSLALFHELPFLCLTPNKLCAIPVLLRLNYKHIDVKMMRGDSKLPCGNYSLMNGDFYTTSKVTSKCTTALDSQRFTSHPQYTQIELNYKHEDVISMRGDSKFTCGNYNFMDEDYFSTKEVTSECRINWCLGNTTVEMWQLEIIIVSSTFYLSVANPDLTPSTNIF